MTIFLKVNSPLWQDFGRNITRKRVNCNFPFLFMFYYASTIECCKPWAQNIVKSNFCKNCSHIVKIQILGVIAEAFLVVRVSFCLKIFSYCDLQKYLTLCASQFVYWRSFVVACHHFVVVMAMLSRFIRQQSLNLRKFLEGVEWKKLQSCSCLTQTVEKFIWLSRCLFQRHNLNDNTPGWQTKEDVIQLRLFYLDAWMLKWWLTVFFVS
jgi:hypothetical protein